jgi:protein gp37
MGVSTKIEWCDHTFNPWWGCTKVSPGCDYCYASNSSKRYGYSVWGKDAPRRFLSDAHWDEARKWNASAERSGTPARVFCGSMCDVMEERRDLADQRAKLYELIPETRWLNWLLLTKRPQNFRKFLPAVWLQSPLANVWGMATVELNVFRWRIRALAETPFVLRGLSCEPLLEDLDLRDYLASGLIHWVIAGGESGSSARGTDLACFRSLRDQCRKAGVAFFLKQITERGKKIHFTLWPEDLQVREWPLTTWK